jgi:hypothetical protein
MNILWGEEEEGASIWSEVSQASPSPPSDKGSMKVETL